MYKDIVDGISIQLNKEFGDKYEIYTDDVKQGLQEPCFFIQLLPVNSKPMLGKRKKRKYMFNIIFFPEKKGTSEELMEVSERLMDALEYIIFVNGDIVRGQNMESDVSDGVLNFSVTYGVFLNDYTSEEEMEEIETNTDVKG